MRYNRCSVMKQLSKVVWFEGMYLGPHHFQAQSRFFEDVLHFDTSLLWYEPRGLAGYELDREALLNGTVAVVHARGFFSDGLAFHMPESDALPAARPIADLFPPTRENVLVMLAVPERKPQGANFDLNGGRNGARYSANEEQIADETTGLDEKPVRVGRKNIRLVLDTEGVEGLVTLPVARVVRDGSGHFAYDPAFIPPCVTIGAGEGLMMMLRRLIDILQEKSAMLSPRGRQGASKFGASLSAQDVGLFWFLHSINSALAVLRHLCFVKRGHPEELYVEMSRLAGALCTFGLDSHPRTLPLYDHDNLEKCFGDLDRHIRAHLEMFVPTNCIAIPLEKVENYFYSGEVTDQRCLDRARWIFSIRSSIGEVEVVQRTQQFVKICSNKFVPELVKRALPGLPLTHMPSPPSAVSPKVENQYFAINRSGPCWESIVKTRQVGVYVPRELPDAEMELLVVLDT